MLANPKAVLDELGVDYPANIDIQIVENTDSRRYFILPLPPSDVELDRADLDKIAAAGGWGSDHGPS